ncbi:MAG: tRNA (N(6)-L-threonylcarbamoyladenosine(37)-C(2))-methylthiotransferase MtaB [Ruminococcus sp.]|nr:tRNA (N(6)-L-threonylcarbamoyladenosine(37)-C(2))-methylthiotransferase MtaB [Ruminococcus sp.]
MTFNVITLGCKVNQYESQVMTEIMLKDGFSLSASKDNADIFIVNTCTVTSVSDSKNRKLIRRIRRNNPDSVIVVTGCMSQAFPEDEVYEICDIVVGNTNRGEIASLIKSHLKSKDKFYEVETHKTGEVFEPLMISDFEERTRAQIKIEDGCNRFCAYCIIPYARGRVRSKDPGELFEEAKTLSAKGYKEIVLVGINLSCFGQETGQNLCDAVETVAKVHGVERIRLGSLEPERLDPEFIERLAKCKKLCPQFHLSLQSGCDETLKRMNRHYTTAEYREIVENLRNSFDNCSITTDVMVGFAGETDEEFNKSLDFVHSIRFGKVHVFSYSRRKGTKGDLLPNQIEQSVKSERSKRMIAVTESDRKDFLQNQVGGVYPVLFERKRPDGYWEGYTMNYTPVHIYSNKELSDVIAEVKIISASDDYCSGELV